MKRKIGRILLSCIFFVVLHSSFVYARNIDIPDDAIEFNGHTYKFYTRSVDWHSAKELCETQGGHLVTITCVEENNFLINNLLNHTQSFYWIGATDEMQEGNWKWVTEEPFSFNNWSEDSPNNNADKEHFAGFMSKEENYDGYSTPIGSWNDFQVSPTDNHGYICEWDFVNTNNEGDATEKYDNNAQQVIAEPSDTDDLKNQQQDSQKSSESEDNINKGFNISFRVDNLSLLGGCSVLSLGGISFIGFIVKKNKQKRKKGERNCK